MGIGTFIGIDGPSIPPHIFGSDILDCGDVAETVYVDRGVLRVEYFRHCSGTLTVLW